MSVAVERQRPMFANHVPVGPISRVLEALYVELAEEGIPDPMETVALRIAAYRKRHALSGQNLGTVRRTLWRIRHRRDVSRGKQIVVKGITFAMADDILCALNKPELWYEDPELAAVYEGISFGGRRQLTVCPGCDGPKWHTSELCHECRTKARRAA